MEYLKKYNLSETDINEILNNIDELDYKELMFNQENVEEILRYFIGIGITDIKSILMFKTYLLYDNLENIKNAINSSDKNIIKLINEDIMNFDIIGL